MLTLCIGNKNYSSWSMRPWVLMRQMGIAFTEHKERFDSFDAQSQFKHALLALNPQGKVPVLIDEGLVIWDSLAIAEYLAEIHPTCRCGPAQPICVPMRAACVPTSTVATALCASIAP